MDVGYIIKKARTERGMTQEELAEKVGVKKSAVAKWENGRVSEIKRTNLKNLADALGLDPNLLLGDEEDSKKPVDEDSKKPVDEDGLTEGQQKLIAFAKTVPEDKVEMILKVMQSIVESG